MTETVGDTRPAFADDSGEPISDYFCQHIGCGKPLYYAGRGRPPVYCEEHKRSKSSTATRVPKASGDVEQAVAALHGLYVSLLLPMQFLTPQTALVWSDKIDALDSQNREILRTNPKLAKQIADAGSKAGAPALIIANLAAIGPVALSAYAELTYRRNTAARQAQETRQHSEDIGGE